MKDFGPIILVEDPFIRNYVRFLLVRHGYSVLDTDVSRACELLHADGGSVVVTNEPEPFVNFAAKIAIIYLSTSPDLDLASRFPSCRVVRKPFRPEDLLTAIRQLGPAD